MILAFRRLDRLAQEHLTRSGGFMSVNRSSETWSAARPLGDGEAVFQHLKADNFTVTDGENDRKVSFDDLAVPLELGRERTQDHSSFLAGQNLVDLEADPLNHGARAIDKIGDGAPAGLFPNP